MKKLSVSVAIGLALGVCVAPSAQAGCTPMHDPGSPCPRAFTHESTLPGAHAGLYGHYVEGHAKLRNTSRLKDTADDGLDAYLWVTYLVKSRGEQVTMAIATASGLGASTVVDWMSPDPAESLKIRVCVGAGETNCAAWG